MSRRTVPRTLTWVATLTMAGAAIGFVITLVLNAFVFDEYDAYGEVTIPGSASLQLPEGEVAVTFHTVLIGGSSGGGGLPVPPLKYRIGGSGGMPNVTLVEDYGTTTTMNNDARVRIGHLQVPVAGAYDINLDGNVSAFLNPRLAFGQGSGYGYLPIVFAALFGFALAALAIARFWAARAGRSEGAGIGAYPPQPGPLPQPGPPPDPFTPTEQGIRIQQLNTLVRLRDSGGLTAAEFEAEKRRLLDGR